MSNYAKVKDHRGLVRDMHSKAVLNIDTEALMDHRKQKATMKNIIENSNKIDKLENDMLEIKEMLSVLIKNSKA